MNSILWRIRGIGKKECRVCGKKSVLISEIIGVCVNCLRSRPEEALPIAMMGHEKSRRKFKLPVNPPRGGEVSCNLCANRCSLSENELSFCGLVSLDSGNLVRIAGTKNIAVGSWYYDPLPTNCVAGWFCPGSTGIGYPKFSVSKRGAERGYYNLAVFYGACNLDCLFCQNWQWREYVRRLSPVISAEELFSKVNERVTCICFFGGDPTPQILHALEVCKLALEYIEDTGRILRICWETNGLVNPELLKRMGEYSLRTGGIVKFDIKAWTPSVYKALTGVDPKWLFDNVKLVVEMGQEREEIPLFTASTLLVPGYVDEYEVRMIARFLAELDQNIPYSLLAFHPDYLMNDLPPTSRDHAMKSLRAAKEEGLKKVNIGNIWLLGDYY
ncbi:MAG: radical SAM protein [Thermoprotei archaeon]|nr:MAG: radical SAM protein [Thermoprotei archaeon]